MSKKLSNTPYVFADLKLIQFILQFNSLKLELEFKTGK